MSQIQHSREPASGRRASGRRASGRRASGRRASGRRASGRRRQRRATRAGLACFAVALAAAGISAGASAARPGTAGAAAAAPQCAATSTETWLGLGLGGGTAGTTYFPLEFSNVGHSSCTFDGYPGVSALGFNDVQLGTPAVRNTVAHATVTLAPGATAHALLGIHDAGAICSKSVTAYALKVYAPGQRMAMSIPLPFAACAKAGVLVVGPLRAGIGIPGYTNS